MSGDAFLHLASLITMGVLTLAFLVCVVRIVIGPTLPDRMLALDMLVNVGIGFIVVVAIKTGFTLYLDIAISLGLAGFLSTVAFARYLLHRAQNRNGAATVAEQEKQN